MDVFINNTFSLKQSSSVKPGKFVDDYMARDDLGKVGEPLLAYSEHEIESTDFDTDDIFNLNISDGIAFTNKEVSIGDKEVAETADKIQNAYDNYHILNRFVISFDNDFLVKAGLLNKTDKDETYSDQYGRKQFLNKADQLKLRLSVQKAMNQYFDAEGYVEPLMVGVFQMDTSHLHCHIAFIDEKFSNNRMKEYDGLMQEKGTISLGIINKINQDIVNNIAYFNKYESYSQNILESETFPEMTTNDKHFSVIHENELLTDLFIKSFKQNQDVIATDTKRIFKGNENSFKDIVSYLSEDKVTFNHARLFDTMIHFNYQTESFDKEKGVVRVNEVLIDSDPYLNYLQIEEWYVKKTLRIFPDSALKTHHDMMYVDSADKIQIESEVLQKFAEIDNQGNAEKTFDINNCAINNLSEYQAATSWQKLTSVAKREIVINFFDDHIYSNFIDLVHKGYEKFSSKFKKFQEKTSELEDFVPKIYRPISIFQSSNSGEKLEETVDEQESYDNENRKKVEKERQEIDQVFWKQIVKRVPLYMTNQYQKIRKKVNDFQRKVKDKAVMLYNGLFEFENTNLDYQIQEVFERRYSDIYKNKNEQTGRQLMDTSISLDEDKKSLYENVLEHNQGAISHLENSFHHVIKEFDTLASLLTDEPYSIENQESNFNALMKDLKSDNLSVEFLSGHSKLILDEVLKGSLKGNKEYDLTNFSKGDFNYNPSTEIVSVFEEKISEAFVQVIAVPYLKAGQKDDLRKSKEVIANKKTFNVRDRVKVMNKNNAEPINSRSRKSRFEDVEF